jgi:hypothetical protein
MGPADIVLDNPILIKHVRSRLRRGAIVPGLVTVLCFCFLILWAGFEIPWMTHVGALAMLLGLQIILLAVMGAQQVAGAVGGARATGILDFHRVSPLPPVWVALGFFLGAPIREYLFAACTLPFAFLSALFGQAGIAGWIQLEVPLLFGAWIFHAIALLASLTARKPKGTNPGASVGGLIVLLLFLGQPAGIGLWYATGQLHDESRFLAFFGLRLPWFAFLLLYELPILAIFFIAAARKMRAERSHAYSKRLAIAALGTIALLALGGLWTVHGVDYAVLMVLYGLIFVGIVLSATVTPDRNEYERGLRRAARHGMHRPSVWEDAGTNRVAVVLLCTIVLVAATLAWEAIEGRQPQNPGLYSQTIAIGVLVVAYYGLGLQFFLLRSPKMGQTFMALFLFLAWGVPLFAGIIALAAFPTPAIGQAILALSPITGISLSSGVIETSGNDLVRLIALAPAVTFAFLFNYLMVATQRRIDLDVRTGLKKEGEENVPEPLGAVIQ